MDPTSNTYPRVKMNLHLIFLCYVTDQSKRVIHEATSQNNFIETEAYRKAKDLLLCNGHVTIVGNPGSGKSRFTFQLIHDVCEIRDIKRLPTAKDPLLLDSPKTILEAMKQYDNLAISVDDALGKDSLSDHVARVWSINDRSITLKCSPISIDRGHCIIVNTRKDIFEKSKRILKGKLLFSDKNVIDLTDCSMSEKEKTAILKELIPTISINDIRSVLKATPTIIGFPQCCNIMAATMNETQQPLEYFFDNPVMPLKEELYRLQTVVPIKYVVLCLVLLEEGCPKSHLSLTNPICKRLLQMYISEDVSQITNEDISEAANACCPFNLGIEFYLFVSHEGMKRQRFHV